MPIFFQKPENALKRANEFIFVGKKQRALDALTDVIKSRKHRSWQKFHEPIILKFLTLCVELKKSHVAKEGLFQYRNICQQVNLKSLEEVVKEYLTLAEVKAEAARKEAHHELLDIDDLDNLVTPESILLSTVSTEGHQDRTDRVVLIPWVKFLWESYRHCLELLRNNYRVERLYHDIAQQGFRFCLKYERKTEFKKMCDLLRAHLGHISKHQNQQTSINLNNPESQAFNMETRLVQLDYAVVMELWQEAYKAIEDIHGLMSLSKKSPKAQLMALYYQKMALVFWKGGNYLYHAAALLRLFYFLKDMKKNITIEELQKMAIRVVISTLSIPMPPVRPEINRLVETDDKIAERNQRLLARLLGLENPPTRASLVRDLIRFGIINLTPQVVQDLYTWLEVEFHPIQLCSRISEALVQIAEESLDLLQYLPLIQDNALFRLLKQVSQVYNTMEFEHLLELAYLNDFDYLEKTVVESVRKHNLPIRIDYRKRCFHFNPVMGVNRNDLFDVPWLDQEQTVLTQLERIHNVLEKCLSKIYPDLLESTRQKVKLGLITEYEAHKYEDHKKILNRHHIIEERKELLENLSYIKEEEERRLMEDKQQKLREAELERMARETEERVKQRILQEKTEMKKKIVLEKIEQLKKSEIGAKIFGSLEQQELENLDPEELLSRQVEQIDREKKELQSKLLTQARKVDHIERAKRLEEIHLLENQYQQFKIEDIKIWNQLQQEKIENLSEEYKTSLQNKNRLKRMIEDKDVFLIVIRAKRQREYQNKMKEYNKLIEHRRKERLEERARKRKMENKKKWLEAREKEIKKQEEKKHAEEMLRPKDTIFEIKKRIVDKEPLKELFASSVKQRLEKVEEKSWREKRDFEICKRDDDNSRKSDDRRSDSSREEQSWRKKDIPKRNVLSHRFFDRDRPKMDSEDWRGRTTEKNTDSYRFNLRGEKRFERKSDPIKKKDIDQKKETTGIQDQEVDKAPTKIRILCANRNQDKPAEVPEDKPKTDVPEKSISYERIATRPRDPDERSSALEKKDGGERRLQECGEPKKPRGPVESSNWRQHDKNWARCKRKDSS